MTTDLSSGAISSILEAVPGIATVLRSPVADAIINLSRAAAGLAPFNPKDAHELIRYAVRRGLIRSDEGERLAAEIERVPRKAAPEAKGSKGATRPGAARPARGKALRRGAAFGARAKSGAKRSRAAAARGKARAAGRVRKRR